MSAKQNKMPGWKEEFLQWERSGAPANDVLWEKLQTRLSPRKKKTMLYLLRAAAVLLLVIGSGYLLFINNKNPANNSSTVTPGNLIKTSAPIVTGTSVKESLPVNVNNYVKKVRIESNREKGLVVVAEKEILPEAVPIEQIESTQDTLKLIIAEAPKKKLKVVHMNEWNAPPPPTYAAVKEAWERETKWLQQEDVLSDQTLPNKRWSIFSPRN